MKKLTRNLGIILIIIGVICLVATQIATSNRLLMAGWLLIALGIIRYIHEVKNGEH